MNPKFKNLEMGSNEPPKKIPNYVGWVTAMIVVLVILVFLDWAGIIRAV